MNALTNSPGKAWHPISPKTNGKRAAGSQRLFCFLNVAWVLDEGQHMIRAGDFRLSWILFLVERLQDAIFNQH